MTSDAVSNPSRAFETPEALLASELTREQKVEALTNWSNELNQLLAAEEENMAGDGNTAARLSAVEKALGSLGEEPPEHDAKA